MWPATASVPESGVTAPVIDLDERRLPGAVLADERVHFARKQFERDGLQRVHARVGLADVDRLENRGPLARHGTFYYARQAGYDRRRRRRKR